ncbi:MAG: hypothetical protein M1156_01630 [Candidatus Marsarchaeota archaeon]|jgi:ribosomal RNA assembly protein|nr:hypothetical protein [Candidatus Marsarchaeota archaeon]
MEHILIPQKRAVILQRIKAKVAEALVCSIEVKDDNEVVIEGDSYAEYNAKNVIQAFGRGFPMSTAYRLLDENYFFKYINLKDVLRNDDQIKRIKARIIGRNGKTKEYIRDVSGVDISIYGNTVGIIGTNEQIDTAIGALRVLIEGGTHKKAYRIMETLRRRHREAT